MTFAQFGTADLDPATRRQLERGQRATEVLKQGQNVPLAVEKQVAMIYALVNGFLDTWEIDRVISFENAFHSYMDANHPELLTTVRDERSISDETAEALARR